MMMLIAIPHLISSRARSTTLPPARYSAPGRLESPLSVGWAKAHKRQVKGGIRRPLGSVIARLDRSRVAFSRYHRARPAKTTLADFPNVGKGSKAPFSRCPQRVRSTSDCGTIAAAQRTDLEGQERSFAEQRTEV
jgi:hypothetical protein